MDAFVNQILLKWDLKTNQNSTLNAEVPVYKLGIVNLKTGWVYRYPETSRSCGRCFLHQYHHSSSTLFCTFNLPDNL